MAFLIFAERAEITVLEVGLGGRLDATNVVQPELCVITPIDFDHEAFLGKSIEAIASEKAGILKPGVPAVFATQRPEALRVLRERTRARSTLLAGGGRWSCTGEGAGFEWVDCRWSVRCLGFTRWRTRGWR